MLLWIIFAFMTAAALLAIVLPLGRAAAATRAGRQSLAVYRDQLRAVETDVDKGLLDPAEAESARAEISRRLLAAADAEAEDGKAAGAAARRGWPAVALSSFVVAASLGGYLALGSPQLSGKPAVERQALQLDQEQLGTLVARVEQHLIENPQDGRGWATLAPVYLRMRDYAKAARAFANAIELEGPTAARYGSYAEALTMQAGGVVTEEARQAFEKARALEPQLMRPRFFLGIAQEQDGNWQAAAATWRALLAEAGEQAPFRPMLQARLAEAEARAGGDQPGPTAEDIARAQSLSGAERSDMIRQMVAGLAARLDEDGGTVEEWLRLIRSYAVLGRDEDAVAAARKARAAFAGDADALARIDLLAEGLAAAAKDGTQVQ